MPPIPKWFAVTTLLACTACNGADISDARRDHLLAGEHGWIDLTLSAPDAAAGFDPATPCLLTFSLDKEGLLGESATLAPAAAGTAPLGYRLVAPAGKHLAELNIAGCVKEAYSAKLALSLENKHLANLVFDGKTLQLRDSLPYEPTSLEWVRGEVLKLQAHDATSADALATLTKLAIASLLLNVLTLGYVFLKRRA
ncbi:hypothetical protein ACFOLJ_06580 [Rugamonas sp. CCM 8940]|uniref:hypothetical protein n=1 Tax=Rugamonas sp. CCM 8940 TaxID=2765359 RepID=UPI0018F29FD6|nr:hypothetical protein [Rugamonas sp. CCM 8940]MBJ7310381.1 hypothetical protein [Rugamonas sp. CCM 8940]